MKVCVTHDIPGPTIKLLQDQGFEVSLSVRPRPLERAELLEFVKGASAVLSLLTDKIDAEVLTAAGPQLKIVANYAVGFDNIDLPAAKERGVIVTNTPSAAITDAVAEHTFGLILSLTKNILPAFKFIQADKYHGWDPNLLLGTQLLGKTLGIVGLGRIGTTVARMAANGFLMRVVYTGPNRKEDFEKEFEARFLTLEKLLAIADFVTLHVPLTPETRYLIGARELSQMKKTAYLINTARGPIVNETDLITALKGKAIAGAGLDVFENEREINLQLRRLENVVLTPHTASATQEARGEMARIAAENIIAVLHGRPALNPAVISS